MSRSIIEDLWNSDEALKKTLYYEYEIKLEGWRPVTTLKDKLGFIKKSNYIASIRIAVKVIYINVNKSLTK